MPPLETTLAPAQPADALGVDELWSFVGHRQRGVVWLWRALCRRTRQSVASALGPRSDATAACLWNRLPGAYRHSILSTDPLESDHNVFPKVQHRAAYQRGPKNHIERFNNTLRQRLGRLVRKTLSFSKGPLLHESVISLFLHRYNREQLQAVEILN